MVVVLPSGFNQGACFGHVAKAVFVEALFAEFPVEAFDALSDELSEACSWTLQFDIPLNRQTLKFGLSRKQPVMLRSQFM